MDTSLNWAGKPRCKRSRLARLRRRNGAHARQRIATGDVTSLSYDNLGRQILRHYADGTFVSLADDQVGNTTMMADSTGSTTYAFDAVNQLLGKTDPGNLSQAYVYDLAGQRTKLTTPDGGVRSMAYDGNGRLTTVTAESGNVVGRQYDAASRLTTLTQTSPAYAGHWTYDAIAQILVAEVSVAGTQNYWLTLTYDPVGNRKSLVDLNGASTVYSYDAKNRLTQDSTIGTNAHVYNYTFDSMDNILSNNESGSIATAMYDLANRLTTVISAAGMTSYTFDNNGNQILVNAAGVRTTMAYDKENRLVNYTAPGSAVSYTYAGDNMKRCEWNSGIPTTLIWDGQSYLQGRQ